MIDVQALTIAVYNRVRVDAAGAPVRALLGAGAASVVAAVKLRVAPLPARPFLALRADAVGGDRTLWRPQFTWWIYDDADPAVGYYRISGLLQPLATAFDQTRHPLVAPGCAVSGAEIAVGDERYDSALTLSYRTLTLTFAT